MVHGKIGMLRNYAGDAEDARSRPARLDAGTKAAAARVVEIRYFLHHAAATPTEAAPPP